ncbi:ANTAR domain-containing protein [Amycolatopsis sp. NPDC059657]|uniref:ANTAR domain-containing protein n=1 Tax=Amycolatopsis sp. NPDC059657 TaxID=3346899 RepID=UPI00366BA428
MSLRESDGFEVDQRIQELRDELDGLRRALRTRATIEQAMGVLIVAQRCGPDQAFRTLVRLSQQHNIKLHRIAQMLVRLASTVPPEQLEPLLRQAIASSPQLEDDEPVWKPDGDLLDRARALLETESAPALASLYELLVDRGWLPPYEVLAGLGKDSKDR